MRKGARFCLASNRFSLSIVSFDLELPNTRAHCSGRSLPQHGAVCIRSNERMLARSVSWSGMVASLAGPAHPSPSMRSYSSLSLSLSLSLVEGHFRLLHIGNCTIAVYSSSSTFHGHTIGATRLATLLSAARLLFLSLALNCLGALNCMCAEIRSAIRTLSFSK